MTWFKTLLKTVLPMLLMTEILGKSQLDRIHQQKRNCTYISRVHATRKVPYTETYLTKRYLTWTVQSRLNFRIEGHRVWNITEVCCEGYKDVGGNKSHPCLPICNNTCVHGICVLPNVCECDEGYALSDSKTCQPVCTTPCINATCTAPNICTCNQGYTADEDGNCKPNCTGDYPANAYCSAPDTFACEKGYNETKGADGLFECRPLCTPKCINGECVAPDTCNCTDGYTPLRNHKHYCRATCKPGCRDGICTAPNTCVCDRGFELSPENQCLPSCTEECINGFCEWPEHCTCHDGYTSKLHSNGTTFCAPHCKKGCFNGQCIAPDTCECDEGYEVDNTKSKQWDLMCRPICIPRCGRHSTCISPQTCRCFVGYHLANHRYVPEKNITVHFFTTCVPICSETCINATCTKPNVCTCHDGYKLSPNGSLSTCAPFCENECGNGTCVEPNKCQCSEGFVHSDNESNSTCISRCDRDCSNHGTCANGQHNCECHFGWAGANCNESTHCVITLDFNNTDIDQVVASNEINSTILDAKDNLPKCDPCANNLNNQTLCYILLEKDKPEMITCFVNAETACSHSRNYESATAQGLYIQVIPTIIGIILLAISAATTYLIFKRRIRKRGRVPVSAAEPMGDQLLPAEPMSDVEINLE